MTPKGHFEINWPLKEDEVVSLAEEDCKGSAHKNTYKAESKNCEHMANKWKTGKSFSVQATVAVTGYNLLQSLIRFYEFKKE